MITKSMQTKRTDFSDLRLVRLVRLAVNADEDYIFDRLLRLGQAQKLLKLDDFLLGHCVVFELFAPVRLNLSLLFRESQCAVEGMEDSSWTSQLPLRPWNVWFKSLTGEDSNARSPLHPNANYYTERL